MKIGFLNVLPHPLADSPLAENSCWKKEFTLDSQQLSVAEAASGRGKTTLLSIIYGIRKDHSGMVSFDGKDIASFSKSDWVNIRMEKLSFVFQDLRLFGDLTAKENIDLKNSLTNTLSDAQITEFAQRLGVDEQLKKPCKKLSLGQQQRIAMIRALAQPFQLLLLDEPFSHLDENNSQKAAALIKEVCEKNNAGIILTSLGPNTFFEYNNRLAI